MHAAAPIRVFGAPTALYRFPLSHFQPFSSPRLQMIQNFQPELMSSQFFNGYAYSGTASPNVYKTPPPGKRERTKFTQQQLSWLEQHFSKCQYPQGPMREKIAQELNLTDVKVQVWFKNRRAKMRQKKKFEDELQRVGSGKREAMLDATNNTSTSSTTLSGGSAGALSGGAESATDEEDKYNPGLAGGGLEPSALAAAAPASAMPVLALAPALTDMSALKLEPLAAAGDGLLHGEGMALNPAFASPGAAAALPQGAALHGQAGFASWMNYPGIFGQYPSQFNFPGYTPYPGAGGAQVGAYDYGAIGATPSYYMNTSTPADLAKF